ncbi:uncharacterized protein DUF3376 [Frondihabitans sp. PhB188]|uniref:DUF3376 domain-containing protein n=1 Tax=Frondihabitans sp. PhB188 TaxID=2485200 RepID=UPI000F4A74A1|nr:DUF3376 domain-containing protein [Frondihabitans sp. PhB188]ROQ41311.1 uncharacterized protein DUF3376 [Frondihabitans sp. PhB188]
MKSRSTLGDLADVQTMNAEIDRVGALTAQLHDTADASLAAFAAPSGPDYWRAATAWAPHVYDSASADGWNRDTYQRLKVDAIGAMMSSDLATALGYPAGTQHLVCVEHLLSTWSSGAFSSEGDDPTPFLRRADLPFQERRLRFLISRVNDLYATATSSDDRRLLDDRRHLDDRGHLDDLKGALWAAQVDLVRARADVAERLVASSAAFLATPSLTPDDVAMPRAFASAHDADLTTLIADYSDALWEHWDGLAHLTEFFEHREPNALFEGIIRDFLWFPVWDAAVFPTIALAKLPQLTPIGLSRFSPVDAALLAPMPGRAKLQGTAVRNFGGFLSRARRENDYVWGRFDGVELILRLLGSSTLDDVAPAFRALAQELAATPTNPDSSRPLLRTRAARRLLAHVRSQLPVDVGPPHPRKTA